MATHISYDREYAGITIRLRHVYLDCLCFTVDNIVLKVGAKRCL
jgi:hypothetical protein